MKKYLFGMGLIMISLILISIKPTYGLVESQNSNVFFEQILKQNNHSIKEICTIDFCDTFSSNHLEKGIETFKKNYYEYLKTKTTEENALSTVLKGFPIIKVVEK